MVARYDTKIIDHLLDSYKRATDLVMDSYIPRDGSGSFLYELMPLYPRRPGKGIRPGLCLATCRSMGGDARHALVSAAALELFHNAFLIHDDVEDGSEFRRGLPTLHNDYGVGIAVNVGDAINVLSLRILMDNLQVLGPDLTWHVFSEIEHMVRQSVEGQAIELEWTRSNRCDLTDDDYLRMTLKKTCWYTCIQPCRIGALIATKSEFDLDRMNRFGYFMGASFQIQDDLLNLIGNYERYGKEIGGDIWEGKRTIMLIHVLNQCTRREMARLKGFLATHRVDRKEDDVTWVLGLMEKYGSIEYGKGVANELAKAALEEFHEAFGEVPDSDDKAFICEMIRFVIDRDL